MASNNIDASSCVFHIDCRQKTEEQRTHSLCFSPHGSTIGGQFGRCLGLDPNISTGMVYSAMDFFVPTFRRPFIIRLIDFIDAFTSSTTNRMTF